MKTCPKCNTTGIPDDATFCPQCGVELISISDDTIKGTPIKETKKPKEHHYFVFVLLFIPFFLGFYVVIAMLFMLIGLDDCSWRTVTPVAIVSTLLVEYLVLRSYN